MTKYVLVGSFLTVGLTGCGSEEKDAIFEGTLLEDAIVLTFDDGSKDVAVVGENAMMMTIMNIIAVL